MITAWVGAIVAIVTTFFLYRKLKAFPMGTDEMNKLQAKIQNGAKVI